MTSMNEAAAGINHHEVLDKAREMMRSVQEACREGQTVRQVEEGLWRRTLQLGRCALEAFFRLCGDGDQGEQVRLPDGREVRRLDQRHRRPYQSVFSFELERTVYGTREDQQIAYIPLDKRLQLPKSKFSYLLQDWDQALEVEVPYAQVSITLERILGFKQSVHSLERNAASARRRVRWRRSGRSNRYRCPLKKGRCWRARPMAKVSRCAKRATRTSLARGKRRKSRAPAARRWR